MNLCHVEIREEGFTGMHSHHPTLATRPAGVSCDVYGDSDGTGHCELGRGWEPTGRAFPPI